MQAWMQTGTASGCSDRMQRGKVKGKGKGRESEAKEIEKRTGGGLHTGLFLNTTDSTGNQKR